MPRLRFLTLFAGTLLMGIAGCATASPPPWAPAHGARVAHHYVYYPEYQLYFAPDRRQWFWPAGAGWRHGPTLPRIYQPYVRHGGITVQLFDRLPYRQHHQVITRHHFGDRRRYQDGNGYDPRQRGWKDGPGLHGWKQQHPPARGHHRDEDHRSRHHRDERRDGHRDDRRWRRDD